MVTVEAADLVVGLAVRLDSEVEDATETSPGTPFSNCSPQSVVTVTPTETIPVCSLAVTTASETAKPKANPTATTILNVTVAQPFAVHSLSWIGIHHLGLHITRIHPRIPVAEIERE